MSMNWFEVISREGEDSREMIRFAVSKAVIIFTAAATATRPLWH
jgi:hypothetical protein